MIIEKFSLKAQDSIENACRLAVKKEHQYVTPWHLLFALLDKQENQVRHLLSQAQADVGKLSARIEGHLITLPKASLDSQQTPINRELEKVFIFAEEAATVMGDKYIRIHHILLGMLELDGLVSALAETGADKAELTAILKHPPLSRTQDGDSPSQGFEYLAKYAIDLTAKAYQLEIDPVIGRDHEIHQTIQVLSRRLKSNPIIIGEPGVGKTAIVEGLAQRIAKGQVPENLKHVRILSLDLGQLIAGAKYRGEFEERFKRVLAEVSGSDDIIMYIDEVHMLMGAGGSGGTMDASNLIKPALSRGELRCMGSTTLEEYRKHIEKDAALMRRFQVVMVPEPTIEETLSILRGIKDKYEVHHGVRILDAAINAAVKLSHRYITDRFLPDKAIDLMDQTAASTCIRLSSKPDALEAMDRRIVQLEIELRALENETDAQVQNRVAGITAELETLKVKSRELTAKWEAEKTAIAEVQSAQKALEEAKKEMEQKVREENFTAVAELQYKIIPECERKLEAYADVDILESRLLQESINEQDVADTVSRLTGIPVSKMMASEQERYLNLETLLRNRVVGQDEALTAIAKAVRRSRAAVQDPNRPVASFLMAGPTGVGKTELAKALCEFLFDDERALIRIDMSEFMEKHTVARLVGAPPGYVGYEEGGILTNKVKRKPYSVILFDEVEKGHPDVFNLFLQLMDDGRLTDSQGHTVNFTNTIILMTSNLGADAIAPAETEDQISAVNEQIMAAVRSHFRPEFLNRLDDIILFQQLTPEAMVPIVDIQISRLQKLLQERHIKMQLADDAKSWLANKGFNPVYGARPLKRVIQSKLQDPLAEKMIAGDIVDGDTVVVSLAPDGLAIHKDEAATGVEAVSEGEP